MAGCAVSAHPGLIRADLQMPPPPPAHAFAWGGERDAKGPDHIQESVCSHEIQHVVPYKTVIFHNSSTKEGLWLSDRASDRHAEDPRLSPQDLLLKKD